MIIRPDVQAVRLAVLPGRHGQKSAGESAGQDPRAREGPEPLTFRHGDGTTILRASDRPVRRQRATVT